MALPAIQPAAGARGRVLAGTAFGATAPLRHPGHPLLVDLELDEGATIDLPDAPERGIFVIHGEIHIGHHPVRRDQLAVIEPDARVCLSAATPTRLLILGGPPTGPRFIDWNFVASTKDRIDRARDAWKAQTFPRIPSDQDEFVPYPELHR